MSLSDIAIAVRLHPIGMYVPMKLLREHYAPYRERLSDGLCSEIQTELDTLNIGHLPASIPNREADMVHLFDKASALANIIDMARSMTLMAAAGSGPVTLARLEELYSPAITELRIRHLLQSIDVAYQRLNESADSDSQ